MNTNDESISPRMSDAALRRALQGALSEQPRDADRAAMEALEQRVMQQWQAQAAERRNAQPVQTPQGARAVQAPQAPQAPRAAQRRQPAEVASAPMSATWRRIIAWRWLGTPVLALAVAAVTWIVLVELPQRQLRQVDILSQMTMGEL